MSKSNFENLRVYNLSVKLSDLVWDVVKHWKEFPKSTIGRQIVRSADSVGANIVEGSGRGTPKDNKRFVRMSRGSLYETIYWLDRTRNRSLISENQFLTIKSITNELAPKLNAYLKSIK